jgi:hypothetical protein
MRRIAVALTIVVLVSTGCHYRAGGALSGVMTLSSTVDTDNPIMVDAWGRIDTAMVQIEASYGYQSYTYDYNDGSTTRQADLEILPLTLTARLALGNPRARGIRKLWLLGAGAVFNTSSDTDIGSLREEDINAFRFSIGHEWDVGKLLILVEAVYQEAQEIVADGLTFSEAVDIRLSGSTARVAVGARF